jgi:Skp family chaperone for outer membrane proteins
MPAPFSEFIDALGREIDAIRGSRRALTISLERGQRSGAAGGEYIYVFELKNLEKRLRDDSPVTLRVAGRDIPGTLISAEESMLRIGVPEDLGQIIATAQLVIEDAFLLERLKSALQDIKDGKSEVTFNTIASNALLKNAASRRRLGPVADDVFQSSVRLNEEQQRAVCLSTGCTLLYLWGPPGTGKTLTLAAMAHAHVLAGNTVLLVSNTNIAVDTALERIGDRLATSPSFHQGAVIRHGPIVSHSLQEKYGSQVTLDAVVARLSEPLQGERRDLETQVVKLTKEVTHLRAVAAAHERQEVLSRQLGDLQRQQSRARQQVHELQNTLVSTHSEREQDQGGISGRFCANWLRISKKVPSKSLIA